MSDKTYRVAVFVSTERSGYTAYLRHYNEKWPGCNMVYVIAKNGDCAKRAAIKEVRRRVLHGEPVNIDRRIIE